MNKNIVIGILAAIIIIAGGWFLVSSGGNSGTATSTPTGTGSPTQTVNTPGTPTVTTGTLVIATNSSAVMTGKILPNGSQTSYWYEYGTTASLGTRTTTQAIGSGFVGISAPAFITGLSANTIYYYRLVAQNANGSVSGGTLSFTTNTNPASVGNAPTTQTNSANSISRTTANLNGNVTPNASDTSFWFEYGESTSLGNTTSFQSAGSGTGSESESISVSDLTPGTKYYFRMNAQNQFGTVNGAILSFVTNGPATPGAPSATTASATTVNSTSATLNGTVNPNGDSTTYWFEYGNDSLLGSILGSTTHQTVAGSGDNPINVAANLGGLASSTTYFYRLVTTNSYGTTRGDIMTFHTKQ
jgi:phosphodiesterase/alkaline phosphatase D-like protein